MTNTEIKQKCDKILWKLFKDECPYLVDMINKLPRIFRKEKYEKGADYCLSNCNEWTILTRILPEIIEYGTEPFFGKMIPSEYQRVLEGNFRLDYKHINIRSDYDKSIFIYQEIGHDRETDDMPDKNTDFWQALLNLLKAIESHPDRDKFIFKWGK